MNNSFSLSSSATTFPSPGGVEPSKEKLRPHSLSISPVPVRPIHLSKRGSDRKLAKEEEDEEEEDRLHRQRVELLQRQLRSESNHGPERALVDSPTGLGSPRSPRSGYSKRSSSESKRASLLDTLGDQDRAYFPPLASPSTGQAVTVSERFVRELGFGTELVCILFY